MEGTPGLKAFKIMNLIFGGFIFGYAAIVFPFEVFSLAGLGIFILPF